MSRVYKVKVSESVERLVHVEDGVVSTLDMLPILPKEQMEKLLADELKDKGFTVENDKAIKKEDDGVEIQVEISTGIVTIRIIDEKDISITAEEEHEVYSPNDVAPTKDQEVSIKVKLKDDLAKQAEEKLEKETEELRKKATKKLEKHIEPIKKELDNIVNELTKKALKTRATQIGEVEELSEGSDGSLVIKIKL